VGPDDDAAHLVDRSGPDQTGLRPLEEVGPALEEGKRYTLVIDQAWRDGTGNPLKETFQKVFKVGPPDRDPPNPARWKIQPPRSETRDALTITFSKPMDHALAQRVIQVTSDSGERMPGKIALEDQERRWIFAPTQPWRRGPYRVVIQTMIEDLAKQHWQTIRCVDLFENVQLRLASSTVKLSFEVRLITRLQVKRCAVALRGVTSSAGQRLKERFRM
jgi:hypothetical protein